MNVKEMQEKVDMVMIVLEESMLRERRMMRSMKKLNKDHTNLSNDLEVLYRELVVRDDKQIEEVKEKVGDIVYKHLRKN